MKKRVLRIEGSEEFVMRKVEEIKGSYHKYERLGNGVHHFYARNGRRMFTIYHLDQYGRTKW